jgi:uncharacterized protein
MTRVIMMLCICALLLPGSTAAAQSAFTPWAPDVRIDGEAPPHHGPYASRRTPVYNGAQGAGFFLVRFFQKVISPQDGPNCRHNPTCSAYGRGAVERHGLVAGGMLAGDRILRCNPFYPPSDDPVPQRIFGR